MSLSIIGPWLSALWNRAQEAGHSEAVRAHPGPAQGTSEHRAQRLMGCEGSVSLVGVEDWRGLVVVYVSETSSGRPGSS